MQWEDKCIDEKLLFYDIEVFAKDALVVFMDVNENIVAEYHLSPRTSGNPFEPIRSLIQDKILVGYNNYHYDDRILTLMMSSNPDNKSLKQANDGIIHGVTKYTKISDDIFSLDAFQQISVAKSGLKKIEANIGMDIEETPYDFDREDQLSPSELEEVFEYCRHDVRATVRIFKMRWESYFVPKFHILKMLPKELALKAVRWNTTTITQTILMGNSSSTKIAPRIPEGGYIHFDEYPFLPQEVIDMWTDPEEKTKKITVTECDVNFEFGFGGLHGVPIHNIKDYHNVKLLDVASMYPNLLIQFNGLEGATERYKEIVEERLKIKHKDPVASNALKLIINSTYGLMRPEYSRIYNPKAASAICFMGQISLFDLCLRLYAEGYRIVNVNTDGVAFTGNDEYSYKTVWEEWEKDYGLTLELSRFDRFYQKDVNNYVAKTREGKIKVKGGDVKKYHDTVDFPKDLADPVGDSWNNTNSYAIVSKAVVDCLLGNAQEVEDVIMENLDKPILFQFILQAGNTYKGNIDEEGNRDYQKINRVFAVKEKYAEPQVYKYKIELDEEGNELVRKAKYPDAPEKMMIVNGDLTGFSLRKYADLGYYASLCNKVLTRWR